MIGRTIVTEDINNWESNKPIVTRSGKLLTVDLLIRNNVPILKFSFEVTKNVTYAKEKEIFFGTRMAPL